VPASCVLSLISSVCKVDTNVSDREFLRRSTEQLHDRPQFDVSCRSDDPGAMLSKLAERAHQKGCDPAAGVA
jgi:hypothetical protein